MPIDVRRAQPADRRPWVWGLGLPLVVLALLTLAVATDWQPLLNVDRAIADRAYELTAGHPLWLDSLRVLADVSTPTALCFLALLLAAVLLVRGHRRVAIWLTSSPRCSWQPRRRRSGCSSANDPSGRRRSTSHRGSRSRPGTQPAGAGSPRAACCSP
jgi:hypothetical protein